MNKLFKCYVVEKRGKRQEIKCTIVRLHYCYCLKVGMNFAPLRWNKTINQAITTEFNLEITQSTWFIVPRTWHFKLVHFKNVLGQTMTLKFEKTDIIQTTPVFQSLCSSQFWFVYCKITLSKLYSWNIIVKYYKPFLNKGICLTQKVLKCQ